MFFFKRKQLELYSPLTGKRISLDQVPDQVFSAKIMGDGFAIEPSDGEVVAPIDGEVVHLFPTKHAIGLKTKEGLEVLIHVGIDTVELNGEGFESFVGVGQKVKKGTLLLKVDLQKIEEKGKPTVTPVVFTNLSDWELNMPEVDQMEKGVTLVAEIKKK